MSDITIGLILVVSFAIVGCFMGSMIISANENGKLKSKIKRLEGQLLIEKESVYIYEQSINDMNSKCMLLEHEYLRLKNEYMGLSRSKNKISVDEDIKEALKFARMHSHPDKGICKNSDKFIKFNELYNKYK